MRSATSDNRVFYIMIISKKTLDETTVLKVEADEYLLKLSVIETIYDDSNLDNIQQKSTFIYLDSDDLNDLCKILSSYRDILNK